MTQCLLGLGWQPQAGALEHIVSLLEASLSPHVSNERQRQVATEIDKLCLNGDFARYLAFLFAESGKMGASDNLRHMSGLVLLRAVRTGLKSGALSEQGLLQVKSSALSVMVDPSAVLRRSACSLVSTIVAFSRLAGWPELLSFLHAALSQSADEGAFAGAFLVLEHVCEDSGEQLASEEGALGVLLPLLLRSFQHPQARFRAQAVKCVNYLMQLESPPPQLNAEALLQGLSVLSQDPSRAVKKEVCTGLTCLMGWRIDVVSPHIASITSFMLGAAEDADEAVASEAVEFFIQVCEDPRVAALALPPHLARLLGVLLRRMQYSEEELAMLGSDADNDTSVPDKQEDIRPSHHGGVSAKGAALSSLPGGGWKALDGSVEDAGSAEAVAGETAGGGDEEGEEDQHLRANTSREEAAEEEEEEGEGEGEGEGGGGGADDYFNVWTVRKAAGNALTELAKVIDAELALPVLLPLLQRSLSSPAWLEREAAVLALGALAAGYTDALDEHLPRLLPFLLEQCAPPQPSHVRVTAMWALGRYAEWVCRAPDPDLLRQCVVALTAAATDRHKRVQQSACSNLSSLAEWAEDRMDPFVPELCDVLMRAYAQYQYNNRKVMLDTLATLFGAAPRGMCQPHVFGKVVPALWADFGSLNDSDVLGLHYMETFGAIVKEAGASFGEFCGPLYQRALTYVEGTVTLLAAAPEMGLSPEEVDREFLYGALELLSALAEGLGELLASLADFDHLLALLAEVLKDEDDVTRETAFAVCGDLAIACPTQFAPIMPHAVAVMKNLFLHQDYSVNVANNAIWAVGEIALRMPPAPLQQQAPDVVNRLVIMLLDDNAEKKLRHNAAITLGRVALSCPHVVAQHLDQVGAAWCSTMRSIQNFGEASEAEKGDCLHGLAKAVALNPAAMASGLNYLCMAALSLKKAGPEVQQLLARMLQQVKHALQQNGSWTRAYASVSQGAQNELKARQLLVP